MTVNNWDSETLANFRVKALELAFASVKDNFHSPDDCTAIAAEYFDFLENGTVPSPAKEEPTADITAGPFTHSESASVAFAAENRALKELLAAVWRI